VLGQWGMRPLCVESGPAALAELRGAAAAGTPYRLLLVDGHMPEMDGFAVVEAVQRQPELSAAKIVMLTSAGMPDDIPRCRRLGVRAYLTKPIKQSDLLAALGRALDESPAPADAKRGERPGGRFGLRILLAEDHPVNRLLAQRLLQRHGHEIETVCNGVEALAALERRRFDLVLMDVQMPELDGFETTRRLRQREQATGGHLPVIAMTAHALLGDRERCLAAGMDGYLAKPIRADELYTAIEAVAPAARAVAAAAPAAPAPRDLAGEDRLAFVAGDETLFRELAELFLASGPEQLRELCAAVSQRDAAAVRRLAHSLKGPVGNFGAHEAFDQASRLESLARANDLVNADSLCAALAASVESLFGELSCYLNGKG